MPATPEPVQLCACPDDPGDRELLRDLRNGDERAAARLYERYARRLLRLTDSRTGPDLATRFDPEDVIQSVFGSFFHQARGGLYEVPDGGDLWPLLVVIALQKLRHYGVRHRAAKRDVRRECRRAEDADDVPLTRLESPDPQPLLNLLAKETVDLLPERYRSIIRWRLEGYEHGEIARLSGHSKRTVERMFQECRQILEEMLREYPHAAPAAAHGDGDRVGPPRDGV